MMAMLRKLFFIERRRQSIPVKHERRKVTPTESSRLLNASIDRFATAVERRSK